MKPSVRLKTMKLSISKKYNKIFNLLCSNAKYVYNACVYSNNVFDAFKSNILNDINIYYNKNYIKNPNELFIEYFDKYLKIYSPIKAHINNNNNIIYKYIITNYRNVILDSAIFNKTINDIKNNLIKNNKIYLDNINNKLLLDNIIENILFSFYKKQYFNIQNKMLNHQTIDNKYNKLLDDVKNKKLFILNKFNYKDIKDKLNSKIKLIVDKNINKIYKKELKLYKTSKKIPSKADIIKKIYNSYTLKSDQLLFKNSVYNKNLGNCKNVLPADITLNIIDKYFEMLKSYYAILKTGNRANKPKFKSLKDKFSLYYFSSSFKLEDNNKLRLNVGKYIIQKYSEMFPNYKLYKKLHFHKTKIVNKKYNKDYVKISQNKYVNKNNFIKTNYVYYHIPKTIKLKMCQIIPYGNNYKMLLVYEVEETIKVNKEKITEENSISIDPGFKNLMTIYNPTGKQKIIRGNEINSINNFYNKKINELKSINKKNKDINIFNRLYDLLNERNNKLNGYINILITYIKNEYKSKKYIIIGYNKGWKTKVNLGNKINRNFYAIPYARIISKLTEQMDKIGIKVITTEESYTSVCDALALEKIGPNKKRLGSRQKRGLFVSSIGKAINADLNGAINIMRKKINLKKIRGKDIYNPRVAIFRELKNSG